MESRLWSRVKGLRISLKVLCKILEVRPLKGNAWWTTPQTPKLLPNSSKMLLESSKWWVQDSEHCYRTHSRIECIKSMFLLPRIMPKISMKKLKFLIKAWIALRLNKWWVSITKAILLNLKDLLIDIFRLTPPNSITTVLHNCTPSIKKRIAKTPTVAEKTL